MHIRGETRTTGREDGAMIVGDRKKKSSTHPSWECDASGEEGVRPAQDGRGVVDLLHKGDIVLAKVLQVDERENDNRQKIN